MKVKIVKCSDKSYWYAKHIGDEFIVSEVVERLGGRLNWYSTKLGRYILVKDVELISEEQSTPALGKKYDQGKPMYNLLPADALEEVVKVLTVGAIRYNEPIDQENWRLVDNPQSRYFSAAQRHLWADKRGEDIDTGTEEHPGTDCYHLACAISSLMFKLQLKIEQASKLKDQK